MNNISTFEEWKLQETFKHKKMQKSNRIDIETGDLASRNKSTGNAILSCNNLTCRDARYKPGE